MYCTMYFPQSSGHQPVGMDQYNSSISYVQDRQNNGDHNYNNNVIHENHHAYSQGQSQQYNSNYPYQVETADAGSHHTAVGARSEAEALFNSSSKYRQLPCRTFISVGTCPYRERCVYLHDPRCVSKEARTRTRKKNKEDSTSDSLFWPVMPQSKVNSRLDGNQQPHVVQEYSVPVPRQDQYEKHDRALYSLWMHFVDFCISNSVVGELSEHLKCVLSSEVLVNMQTKAPRLNVFVKLSQCHNDTVKSNIALSAQASLENAPQKSLIGNQNTEDMDTSQEFQPISLNSSLMHNSPETFAPNSFAKDPFLQGKRPGVTAALTGMNYRSQFGPNDFEDNLSLESITRMSPNTVSATSMKLHPDGIINSTDTEEHRNLHQQAYQSQINGNSVMGILSGP